MFIYTRFEELRSEKGVTKKFIADAIGRNQSVCQDWKKGKSVPNNEQLDVVAGILETTPAYLKGETDKKNKPTNDGELSEQDKIIFDLFHSLPEQERERALAVLRALADK